MTVASMVDGDDGGGGIVMEEDGNDVGVEAREDWPTRTWRGEAREPATEGEAS